MASIMFPEQPELSHRAAPDGLLEIAPGVYAFSHCFSSNALEVLDSTAQMTAVIEKLRGFHDFNDKSYVVVNFVSKSSENEVSRFLSKYDISVIEYPVNYAGTPVLTVKTMHHFLESSKNWLSFSQNSYILLHSDVFGWAILPFVLAALLVYTEYYTDDKKTLEIMYGHAHDEHFEMFFRFNHMPSQLRYLRYISRMSDFAEWPPGNKAITLDCVVVRSVPNFDSRGGCRPIIRVYGPDPQMLTNPNPVLLFSSSKDVVPSYKAEELVEVDIDCLVQGDVVVECVNVDDDDHEQAMFSFMFNTAFLELNILMLSRDQIDALWNAKDLFPVNFRVEAHFSGLEDYFSESETHFSDAEEITIHRDASVWNQHQKSVPDSEDLREYFTPTSQDVGDDAFRTPRYQNPLMSAPAVPQRPPSLPLGSNQTNASSKNKSLNQGDVNSGPLPPQPPPLPGMQSQGTADVTRKTSLKPLRWEKIPHPMEGSIWDELSHNVEEPETSEFDMDELETLFSAMRNSDASITDVSSRQSMADKEPMV